MAKPKSFDAIVVGAGIPGLYAAGELRASGRTVLLIEASRHPENPDYSTAGIPCETLHEFDLPIGAVNASIRHQVIGTTRKQTQKTAEHRATFAYVLDFGGMKRRMSERCRASGVEVHYGERALGWEPAVFEGQPQQLNTSLGAYRAPIVVDASGSVGVIATQAGLRPRSVGRLCVGMEYRIRTAQRALRRFEDTIALFFDAHLLPYGYGWVFADGDGLFKVGAIEYWTDPARRLPALEQRLKAFAGWLGVDLSDSAFEVLGKHGGSKLISGNFAAVRAGGMFAIGDSIGAINPFLAEGIRQGLMSAKLAVQAIIRNDFAAYERSWKRFKGARWPLSELFAHLCYAHPTQAFCDAIVEIAARMTSEELRRLVFQYEFELILKRAPFESGRTLLQQRAAIVEFLQDARLARGIS
jgi:flavin-dependent dehydrogenase